MDSKNTAVAISIKKLTRCFNSFTAVSAIDFDIAQGITFGLLGSNGAGKTTTIKMLTTLLQPSSGTATVGGHDIITSPQAVRENIGYIPQLFSADAELSGYENLLMSAKLYGIRSSERKSRIAQVLEFMGLSEFANRLVRDYSGGMIRKLEIAQAILHKPKVLFMDEPTTGLDPVARRLVWKHIQELHRDLHTTIILTTHDMEEADHLCSMLGFMSRGKIRALGSPAELKKAVGNNATLNDVFIHFTGSTISDEDTYDNTRQMRQILNARN